MKNEEIKKEEILEEEKTMEVEENEEVVNEESLVVSEENSIVTGFDSVQKPKSATRKKIQTTIEDPKVLFNLQDHVDFKLNDMEGKEINVVDVMITTYESDKENVNEETGEITTEVERKMITVLVDDTGTSYLTASKLFAIRVIQMMQLYGNKVHKGIKIKITKTPHKDGNKKLGFEIL